MNKLIYIFIAFQKYLFLIKTSTKFIENKSKLNKLNKNITILTKKFKYLLKTESNISDKSPIWVMIYNGIEKETPIINACLKSIISNAGNHTIYILDRNNYSKFISLPPLILEKFHKKIFNSSHLSEIIKIGLLFEYGGYWIDSSYFITTPISSINSSFFTLKLKSFKCKYEINKCLWDSSFLATSKNSFLATYVYNAIINYWKNYDFLIHNSLT